MASFDIQTISREMVLPKLNGKKRPLSHSISELVKDVKKTRLFGRSNFVTTMD